MQRGTLLDFGKNAKGSVFGKQKLKLPEILAMDDAREVLELSLAHFEDWMLMVADIETHVRPWGIYTHMCRDRVMTNLCFTHLGIRYAVMV